MSDEDAFQHMIRGLDWMKRLSVVLRGKIFQACCKAEMQLGARLNSVEYILPRIPSITQPSAFLVRPTLHPHRMTTRALSTAHDMASTVGKYVLTYYVPTEHSKAVTSAIHALGAGTWPGNTYGETCFITDGTGQFRKTTHRRWANS